MKKILFIMFCIVTCQADFLSLEDDHPLGEHLLEAVAKHQLEEVKTILGQDPKLLDYQDPEIKKTPLHEALVKEYKDITDLLIAQGARKDIKNIHGFTAQDLMKNGIEKLEEEWFDFYTVFYTWTLSNTNVTQVKIEWLQKQWAAYYDKLMKWFNALPLSNTFSRSTQDNLKKALEALKDPWQLVKESLLKPGSKELLQKESDKYKKLITKNNLAGKLGRLGDNKTTIALKKLLADNIILAVIDLYALGEMKDTTIKTKK